MLNVFLFLLFYFFYLRSKLKSKEKAIRKFCEGLKVLPRGVHVQEPAPFEGFKEEGESFSWWPRRLF